MSKTSGFLDNTDESIQNEIHDAAMEKIGRRLLEKREDQ
jgi:hypothetical protein